MNVSVLTQYVALFCLLAFSAFSNALYAQSTEGQTESNGKATAPVLHKHQVVVKTSNGVNTTTTTTTNGETPETRQEVRVIRIKGNGAESKPIVVKQLTENGKTTMTVNGKEVDAAAALPEDVQKMLDNLEISVETNDSEMPMRHVQVLELQNGGKGGIQVFSSGNSAAQVMVLGDDGEKADVDIKKMDGDQVSKNFITHMWTTRPKCRPAGVDSVHAYKFEYKFDAEAIKQHCKEIQEKLGAMHLDSTISHQCHGVMPHMVMMEGGADIFVEIPEVPSVKSFETDDLGDVSQLYVAPPDVDAAFDALPVPPTSEPRKRYRVIIIERPDGDEAAEKAEATEVEIDDASPATEAETDSDSDSFSSDTLPLGVSENNAIKAEYFNVYPNPTPGVLNISFALTQPGTATVTVSDLLGNRVFNEVVERLSGQYYKQLDMSERARGTYIVRVEQNGQAISRTISVQ